MNKITPHRKIVKTVLPPMVLVDGYIWMYEFNNSLYLLISILEKVYYNFVICARILRCAILVPVLIMRCTACVNGR